MKTNGGNNMSKSQKIISIIVVAILIVIIIYAQIRPKPKDIEQKESYPNITLKGKQIIQIKMGETYQEPGYEAQDRIDGNITNKVKVESNIDYNQPGTYEILYTITNSQNNKMQVKRFINITRPESVTYKPEYNNLNNTSQGWGNNNKKDQTRPTGNATIEELKKYNAYYIGNDEKVIYLTFDEGSNETYLKEIVDVLNKNNVKATFFLCRRYILDNEELMKILVESGHSVGNHTANHYNMPSLATEANFQKYLNEIKQTEEAFQSVTGKEIDKVYREPKGEWSPRSLQIIKDLGYKTYFWSASYVDFQGDLTKDQALKNMMERYHNGAIYLIHPTNKGNYEALEDFIKNMKIKGYTFDLVKNIK